MGSIDVTPRKGLYRHKWEVRGKGRVALCARCQCRREMRAVKNTVGRFAGTTTYAPHYIYKGAECGRTMPPCKPEKTPRAAK